MHDCYKLKVCELCIKSTEPCFEVIYLNLEWFACIHNVYVHIDYTTIIGFH